MGATVFYGVPNEAAVAAAIVLHVVSIGPSLVLGLFFAAQVGVNLSSLSRMAGHAQEGPANG